MKSPVVPLGVERLSAVPLSAGPPKPLPPEAVALTTFEVVAKPDGEAVVFVAFHAANEPWIGLAQPVRYDDGRIVEGQAALGQSVCILENTKPGEARRAPGPVLPKWSNQ